MFARIQERRRSGLCRCYKSTLISWHEATPLLLQVSAPLFDNYLPDFRGMTAGGKGPLDLSYIRSACLSGLKCSHWRENRTATSAHPSIVMMKTNKREVLENKVVSLDVAELVEFLSGAHNALGSILSTRRIQSSRPP